MSLYSPPVRDPYFYTPTQTSNYVARPWEAVDCDTSGGSFTVTLPVVTVGAVKVFDSIATDIGTGFGVNPVTVAAPPGVTVMGRPSITLSNGGTQAVFQHVNNDWRLSLHSIPSLPITSSKVIWVDPDGDDLQPGALPDAPKRTLANALAQAEPGDCIRLRSGVYVESVPLVVPREVCIMADSLRSTEIRPTEATKNNNILLVDSGVKLWGLTFAGHQEGSFAVAFNPDADNRAIGAVSLGAYILKSPYVQNCTSYTAAQDGGLAGSISQGVTGGGMEVDGDKCALNSPIRSMVVDSFTQVNLNGPGCLVKNDAYAQLVSFFATFCTYHVRTETGGQVNLSGGSTTDFGTYGLMADGYSKQPTHTGLARVSAYGAPFVELNFSIDLGDNSTFICGNHTLREGDRIQVSAVDGDLPDGLLPNTNYYVLALGLTTNEFRVSDQIGGSPIVIPTNDGTSYLFNRQGDVDIDVINFTPSRLGRQLKYPTPGSAGSPQLPTSVITTSGNSFTVALDSADFPHEYVAGGTVLVNGSEYEITSAIYDHSTGITIITAADYVATIGDIVILEGLSFSCSSSSRPNPGQLMFPQLRFPRNAETGVAGPKTFPYLRLSNRILTYTEVAAPEGPDHQYVDGGTAVIGGLDYGIEDAVYDRVSGIVTITTKNNLPSGNGSVIMDGLNFICPDSGYVVTSAAPIAQSGALVPEGSPSQAGYRVSFYSVLNRGLKDRIDPGQVLDFRNRSQISAPSHTFEYVGSGTNYDALPWNGGVPVPANRIIEFNNGRVYSSNTDEQGNFAVGTQFSVDGTTGAVTINTDQFDLSGLNFIGPFSRNGGISTVGEQLREISNNPFLLASTGAPDGNTVPTQFAVVTFLENNYTPRSRTLSAGTGLVGGGNLTQDRSFALSPASLQSLALADSAVQPTDIQDFETTTQLNARDTANRNRATHTGTQAISTISGLQAALDDPAILRTLNLGVTVQPFNPNTVIDADYVRTDENFTTAEKAKLGGIEAGAQVNVKADWNAVSGPGEILNKPVVTSPAQLDIRDTNNRNRANHTGTQAISTVLNLQTTLDAKINTTAIGVTVQPFSANTVIDANYLGFTLAERQKLATIQEGAEVNVKADWNATSGPAEILNKPSFSTSDLDLRDAANRNRANHTGSQAISTITSLQSSLDAKANLASPSFSGTPTAPTATQGTSTTQIATTSFVTTGLNNRASLSSPAFTGTPTAPTPDSSSNNTTIATTAFVQNLVSGPDQRTAVALGGNTVNCTLGNYFTRTISSNSTFTFSSPPASGIAYAFTLELTHTGGTITWPTSVRWVNDSTPNLITGRTHIFVFVTDDGGTRWRGAALPNYQN